jgi:hypothetical protein
MKVHRLRFTIGQGITLIAVLAVFFASLRTPFWPLVLALGLILGGFEVDRSRGELGIDGAMIAGVIGSPSIGFVIYGVFHVLDGFQHFSLAEFVVFLSQLAFGGWCLGFVVGCWSFMILCAFNGVPGPSAPGDETPGPIVWRGPEDGKYPPRPAGGHPG